MEGFLSFELSACETGCEESYWRTREAPWNHLCIPDAVRVERKAQNPCVGRDNSKVRTESLSASKCIAPALDLTVVSEGG